MYLTNKCNFFQITSNNLMMVTVTYKNCGWSLLWQNFAKIKCTWVELLWSKTVANTVQTVRFGQVNVRSHPQRRSCIQVSTAQVYEPGTGSFNTVGITERDGWGLRELCQLWRTGESRSRENRGRNGEEGPRHAYLTDNHHDAPKKGLYLPHRWITRHGILIKHQENKTHRQSSRPIAWPLQNPIQTPGNPFWCH